MAGRYVFLILLASLISVPRITNAQEEKPDQISALLFDAYIARQGKINTSTIMAASHIVAESGRMSGFWKNVLAELQKGDERSEIGCVRVLGKMLATDAAARDAIRRQKETGEISAWAASVQLGPQVVQELIERGQQADRFRIDHYAVALARARVPEARDFFLSILGAKTGPAPGGAAAGEVAPTGFYHLGGTRFHAAVGLAQLGDPMGIEWLIANCEDVNGDVASARPYFADRGGSLGSCCVGALRQLSGDRSLTSKAEWEAWLKTTDRATLTSRAVEFIDP